MGKIVLIKLAGVGMTDYILGENARNICDLCFAVTGILIILALVYVKKIFA